MKKYKKIYIEITNRCNLSCSFCSKVEKPLRNMTIEEFKLIISKIKDKTDTIYLHVKGEPLVHPNLVDFLDIAEENNLKVNITTNGTLFPQLVDKKKDKKSLTKINFSLHSENNYPNYLENIFKSVDKINKTIIYRLWTLKDGSLDEKSTSTVDKIGEYYNLSPDIVDKIKKEKNIKIKDTIYVDKDNEFDWPSITNHNSCGFCYALKTHIAILVDGTVVPCCLDSNGIINLGNIYNDEIDDIISDLAESMSFNPLPNGICLYDFRRGNCTDGDGCFFYNCPNYITEVKFYPILKKELDLMELEMKRLKKLGRERDWQRQYVKHTHLKRLVDELEAQKNG